MIKKFLFLTTLFLLVFGGGKAWAQNVTFHYDETNPDANGATKDGVTISFSKGSQSGTTDFRFDSNSTDGTITVSSTNTITGITFVFDGSDNDRTGGPLTISSGGGTYSNNSWTGTSTSVVFQSWNKMRLKNATVTYITGSNVTPTISISVPVKDDQNSDVTISESLAQLLTGHTLTPIPKVEYNSTDITSSFDITYEILNDPSEANAASISGTKLSAGHAVGKFYLRATATPKSEVTGYTSCSTTVGFQVNSSAGDGANQDLFTINNFSFAPTTSGLNSSDNKLDRTLKGFQFTFSSGEAIKYNNGEEILMRYAGGSGGKIGIMENNQGKCTIYKIEITYRTYGDEQSDATIVTNAVTDAAGETTFLPATNSQFKTVTITLGRSWASMQLTSSNSIWIKSIKLYYDKGTGFDATLVTPTLSFATATVSATVGDDVTESVFTTTNPQYLKVTYSSSDSSVATVDANTGEVTAVAPGSTTITAAFTGTDFIGAASNATYTVNITPKPVTFSPGSGEVTSGTSVTLSTTTEGASIYYTTDGTDPTSTSTLYSSPIVITASTTLKAVAIMNGVSGLVSTATYTVAGASALTPESDRTWTFDQFSVSSIKSAVIENNMELVGDDTHDMAITSSNKTYEGVKYTSRLQFKDAGSSTYRYIHFKVEANTKVSVWGVSAKSGVSRAIYIDTGSISDTHKATTDFGNDMATLSTETISSATDVYIYAGSGVNIYGVKVEPVGKSTLTRFSPKGGQYTTLNKGGKTTWPDFEILYEPTDAGIESSQLSISSSDASVIGTSGVTFDCSTAGKVIVKGMPMGVGGTSRVTFTFSGNDSYASATTYVDLTVTAPGPFNIVAPDQEVQKGQLTAITPIITDNSGNRIGIRETATSGVYETYVLDEEEETPDYSDYFVFSFTNADGSGTNYDQIAVVDANPGQIRTESTDGTTAADVGAWRNITISATPNEEYQSLFSSGSSAQTTTTKITIIEKVSEIQLKFYWDAACTREVSASEYSEDATKLRTFKSGIFSGGFPNGRMFYAKLSDEAVAAGVNAIWFSYAENGNAATISDDPSINKKKRIFKYNRGVPIYVDDSFVSGTSYVTLNIVAVNSNGNLYGSVARFKFPLVSHARPEAPTYDPVSPDVDSSKNKVDDDKSRKIMDTSENVVAYGASDNLVYGKFSTSTVYHTEQLINEEHVQKGISSVPVVSTEVAKRRFTAVQIYTNTSDGTYGYGEYISPQTYTEYWYLYDTRLALTPSGDEYINVSSSSTSGNKVSSVRETTVKWYNKITPGWQDVDTKTVTFSIVTRNGASDATINEATGAVTAGAQTGWVRVRAYYGGGETHGGTTGEPQYVSTTAPSDAYFYVYIADPAKEEPEITPPTRNFTSTQAFKIKAPANWDVYYTLNGPTPAYGTGTYLKHGSTFEGVATTTTIVQAIAYNPESTSQVSRVVSETYTKVDAIPDPIFDPDGVPSPYYYYTTSLTVQIACARAGAVIYYTVDGTEPEIGAEGTYKYSGLEKVVISGNVAIKAIAYDPATDIFSNVVTSNYIYTTDMEKPYFQVSEDGTTWKGLGSAGATTLTVNGTCWYGGEEITIAPSWQIRIVDPNSIQGTIYFTLDGSVPGESSNSIKYATPFTIAKTTTGKAVTVLDEASSSVSTAVFIINRNKYPVWEAVEQTTPGGVLAKDDGFVISTNSSLSVTNSGSKVNTNSLASGGTGYITYAQADITATFGGYDLEGWSYMTIADDAIGTPLDNVGDYTIKATDNARIEAKVKRTNDSGKEVSVDAYNHIYSELTTTHEKTFKLPAKGAYVRFEPEKDGDLTIWVLQQGSIHYEDDQYLCDEFIRCRPVYFIDEQGKSYQVKTVNNIPQMWSTARLSENWSKVKATADASAWAGFIENKADGVSGDGKGQSITLRDGSTKWIPNTGFTPDESTTLYDRFSTYLTENNISVGDPIQPIAIHTGTETHSQANGLYKDSSNDGTGYVLISGGYAKYTFEVKAGKTYFFLGQGTKIGIRGFQFIPTEEVNSRKTITITDSKTTITGPYNDEKTPYDIKTNYGAHTVDVTLNRSFKKDTWASLVLPFSVSPTQLEKAFGAGTAVIHFNNIVNYNTIQFMLHNHQMLVAGTPAIIKPTKADADMSNVTFEGVQIEADEVETITGACADYSMIGSLVKTDATGYISMHRYDYFIGNDGKLYRFNDGNTETTAYPGSRGWLRPKEANSSRMMTADFSFTPEDEDMTTGIYTIEVVNSDGSTFNNGVVDKDAVYNLNGQKVSNGSLEGLSKGIYIVNGKKKIVE